MESIENFLKDIHNLMKAKQILVSVFTDLMIYNEVTKETKDKIDDYFSNNEV